MCTMNHSKEMLKWDLEVEYDTTLFSFALSLILQADFVDIDSLWKQAQEVCGFNRANLPCIR